MVGVQRTMMPKKEKKRAVTETIEPELTFV